MTFSSEWVLVTDQLPEKTAWTIMEEVPVIRAVGTHFHNTHIARLYYRLVESGVELHGSPGDARKWVNRWISHVQIKEQWTVQVVAKQCDSFNAFIEMELE